MVDVRTMGILLIGAAAYIGCCGAIIRAFFLPRPDGTALPSAAWWLLGAALLSTVVTILGTESPALAYSCIVLAALLAGQGFLSLWWRGKAMQAEISALRSAAAGNRATYGGDAAAQSEPSLRDLGAACAMTARAYDLTRREEDVLRLLVEGCGSGEVAEQLVISPNTAKSHIRHIYRKMGINGKQGIRARMDEACRP